MFSRTNSGDDGLHGLDRFGRAGELGGRAVAMVLAGGKGERLQPLTRHRLKAAVPFGTRSRLIDFVLSNLLNSGIRDVHVLAQYNSLSLLRHVQRCWTASAPDGRRFIQPALPGGNGWGGGYQGTADAVYQNLSLLRSSEPDLVLVFGSDHIYSMDVRPMIEWHLAKGAEITVSTIPLPIGECARFGTASIDSDWRIREFREKVGNPAGIPGRPGSALASMGNYIFDLRALIEELIEDARDPASLHDFGRNILPQACRRRRVYAYDFGANAVPGGGLPSGYWRDVGTVESFYQANLELNAPASPLVFSPRLWPLGPAAGVGPVSDFVLRRASAFEVIEGSSVSGSAVIDRGTIRNSVVGPEVWVRRGALVESSIILGKAVIGEGARIRGAIIDHGNTIAAGERIGYDPGRDAVRYRLSAAGIVVVPHAQREEQDEGIPRWTEDAHSAGIGA
jgi:glucose-1-phosphate adenylyltransferase